MSTLWAVKADKRRWEATGRALGSGVVLGLAVALGALPLVRVGARAIQPRVQAWPAPPQVRAAPKFHVMSRALAAPQVYAAPVADAEPPPQSWPYPRLVAHIRTGSHIEHIEPWSQFESETGSQIETVYGGETETDYRGQSQTGTGLQTGTGPQTESLPAPPPSAGPKPETSMTHQQARALFRSVDTILKFDSQDTGLQIKHPVKRRLTTRRAVEAFLVQKMKEDKDTARVERSGIVLKKFGLLPADFELRPFMLSLLKEQIAGYYDSKTKTVNLLNWINPEEQKPVLAHELTHALQDQHVDLEKWGDQSYVAPGGTPRNVTEDNREIRSDEDDTAREAAIEGQAMVAYMDWSLAPMAQSLRTSPDIPLDPPETTDKPDPDSPILSSAPLVLRASLLFPYQDGLRFEQILLKDQGAHAAFAAVLDRPPSSSYEIMHPREYEQHAKPALLTLPDLHPLLDPEYKPYDIGVMGELDVRMLGEIFGGAGPAADLAKTWDGGVYYAAQSKAAVAAGDGNSTSSIGLLYLSQWTTPEAALGFAQLYGKSLGRKYTQLTDEGAQAGGDAACGQGTADCPPAKSWGIQRFSSEEGSIVIMHWGRRVFIAEGFPEPLAGQLGRLMGAPAMPLDGEIPIAKPVQSSRAVRSSNPVTSNPVTSSPAMGELTAPLVRLFGAFGMMRAGLRLEQSAVPHVYSSFAFGRVFAVRPVPAQIMDDAQTELKSPRPSGTEQDTCSRHR